MKYTNKYSLPDALVNAIIATQREYSGPKNKTDIISCTTLISPPRIHYLKIRHWDEIVIDVSSLIWSFCGTVVHSVLEKCANRNHLVEERQERIIDGITISGQADTITNDGSCEDWKFTTLYSVKGKDGPKPEWVKQLNVLRWIFFPIFQLNKLTIQAILRDWSKGQYKRNPTEITPVQFKSVEITDIWPIEKTEEYIKERVKLFKSCNDLSDTDLPKCTMEEMWAKETIWAIMKKGRVSAVKLCYSEEEALANKSLGDSIETRHGERIRCEDYCDIKEFCSQYKDYLKSKEGK